MISIIINAFGVCVGGTIGIFLRKYISEKYINSIFSIMGVVTIILGLQGVISSEYMIFIIISLFLGSIIGVFVNLSGRIDNLSKKYSGDEDFVASMVTIFLIQCTGALAILGPMKAGLEGDYSIIYFKTILDFSSGIIFASMYGKSIYGAALLLFIYQGGIFLLSHLVQPILDTTTIEQITQIGSVILVALGIEMLDLKKMNVVNYLPAILAPIIYALVKSFFS